MSCYTITFLYARDMLHRVSEHSASVKQNMKRIEWKQVAERLGEKSVINIGKQLALLYALREFKISLWSCFMSTRPYALELSSFLNVFAPNS
jgi:hypothetical protein